jgi:hypothetical protein
MVCIWDVRWLWQFRGDRLSSSKVHSWMLPAHSTMVWGKIVEVRPGRRGKRCHLLPTNTTLLHPPRCWHNCNCAPPPDEEEEGGTYLIVPPGTLWEDVIMCQFWLSYCCCCPTWRKLCHWNDTRKKWLMQTGHTAELWRGYLLGAFKVCMLTSSGQCDLVRMRPWWKMVDKFKRFTAHKIR